jgi:hypothetical protein
VIRRLRRRTDATQPRAQVHVGAAGTNVGDMRLCAPSVPPVSSVVARALVCAIALALAAPPALAARKKKPAQKPKVEMLDVVVLPFGSLSSGKAAEAKEALELELELVDNVRVLSAEQVLGDLEDAGKNGYAKENLARMLNKRGIEVLVGTPPGPKPLIVAWAKDGEPRVAREVTSGWAADELATAALAVLKPALEEWSQQKPIALPGSKRAARNNSDDEDVDVLTGDDDDDAPNPPVVKAPKDPTDEDTRRRRNTDEPRRTRSLDDEDEPPPRKTTRTVDGNDDVLDGDAPRGAKKKAERRLREDVDDDEAAVERKRRAALDDTDVSGLDGGRRSDVDTKDALDDDDEGTVLKTFHTFSVSLGGEGSYWFYSFAPNNPELPAPNNVSTPFHGGGSLRLDVWPVEAFGVDADVAVVAAPFLLDADGNRFQPGEFWSTRINAGASAKGRLLIPIGDEGVLRVVGIGVRAGYRYWSASVEKQILRATGSVFTLVPGFQSHSLAVGPEVYLPLFFGKRRMEIEARIDTLPLVHYEEQPDNPGGSTLAFGYHAELQFRADLIDGLYAELVGRSTGFSVNFTGQGDRFVDVNSPTALDGGRSLNLNLGGALAIGYMF